MLVLCLGQTVSSSDFQIEGRYGRLWRRGAGRTLGYHTIGRPARVPAGAGAIAMATAGFGRCLSGATGVAGVPPAGVWVLQFAWPERWHWARGLGRRWLLEAAPQVLEGTSGTALDVAGVAGVAGSVCECLTQVHPVARTQVRATRRTAGDVAARIVKISSPAGCDGIGRSIKNSATQFVGRTEER